MPVSAREKTFNGLYAQTRDAVYAYLKHYTTDDHLVEDLMQQAYLKIWENLDQVRDPAGALPLVKTYAKNLLIDLIRRRMREDLQWMETVQAEVANLVETPASSDNAHQLHVLDAAIDRLPGKCRAVYVYHREEGLSYREIAARLSISVSMVEKHMSKAIRLLKDELLTDPSLLLLLVAAGRTFVP